MEFIFILMLFLVIMIIRSGSITKLKQPFCYTLKIPHKWIRKGEEPDTYLVCETCKMLPGGQIEEGD